MAAVIPAFAGELRAAVVGANIVQVTRDGADLVVECDSTITRADHEAIDGAIAAHVGRPVGPYSDGLQTVGSETRNATTDNKQIFAPTFESTDGLHPRWKSFLYTCTAGAVSIFDEEITIEKQLRGGWYELMDGKAVEGDYIEESVVDKNDVLGLFPLFGYTVGQDVLELQKYIETEYVNPLTPGSRIGFRVSSTFVIVAGLFTRTVYHSFGAEDVKVKVGKIEYA